MVPMIVDCAVYRDGKRKPEEVGDLSDALDLTRAEGGSGFLWIGLYEPTEDEFAHVIDEFSLHPLAVEDAVNAHQRPKLERYEGSLFIVLKTLRYFEETSDIETGEVMAFLGDRFVITVRHGEANPLTEVRRRLEAEPELLACGPSAVLYGVCDTIVDSYTEIADEVEQDLEETEVAVFSPDRANQSARVYALKREVLEFRRAAMPLVDPIQRLAEGEVAEVHEHTKEFFRDVADHLTRVVEQVESADRLLTDVLSANLAQVSVQQNDDVRRISAWAAIVAVPTLVAGVYGMNFDHMPELHWKYGYLIVLLAMLGACGALYRAFKRGGWL